jgi:DNA-binding transcriptional ArsR family regulator
MALDGNLRDFGLEAIFQLINSEKKTGTLHIVRKIGDAEGFVYFRRGKIFGAVSNFNRQPLGERLVNAGYITSEQLHQALDVQRAGKKRRKLGQILISEGLITEEILRTFVKEQIQNTVFDLLPWTDGDFKFFEDQLPASEDMGLLLSARKILSQSSTRLDEWDRIRVRVPSVRAIFARTSEGSEKAQASGFTPLHWKVADLVDGERSIAEIAKLLSVSEFEASTHIFDLAEAALVDIIAGQGEEEADNEALAPGGRLDALDALEELELSPDDIISDRTHYIGELVALTDGARRGHRGRIFLPAAGAAVLSERVHLDRHLTLPVLDQLVAFVKGL